MQQVSITTSINNSDDILEQLINFKHAYCLSSFLVQYNGGQSTLTFDTLPTTDLEALADDLGLPHHALSN